MSKFYTVRQNNSGGHFIQNDTVDLYVCVEADNIEDAEQRFYKIIENYSESCFCCGLRWRVWWEDEETDYDVPTIYGKPYQEYIEQNGREKGKIIIYYLDGRVEKHQLKGEKDGK